MFVTHFQTFATPSENSRLLELVEKLSREKAELRTVLSHLEEEIQQYKIREVIH